MSVVRPELIVPTKKRGIVVNVAVLCWCATLKTVKSDWHGPAGMNTPPASASSFPVQPG
ncbi:hypothetical protein [Erwinia psidii]|uniref:hypothetical protein n=1 Tax=Erwinia psidii TaxID=69224 RepID=UPI00226B0553|nr:hypothetical protein [Erwinia psidii]